MKEISEAKIENVINLACKKADMKRDFVFSKTRNRSVVNVRHEIMYKLVHELGMTTSETGDYLGRTHATVINGCRKFIKLYSSIKDNDSKINTILNDVDNSGSELVRLLKIEKYKLLEQIDNIDKLIQCYEL